MKKRIISILMALVMALSLLPAGALAAGLPFTDVKTSDWFYNDVKNAYEDGLINGKTTTTFEPNSNLTYAEAVKLAACMHQRNATGMVTLVNGNPWYNTYVGYAKDNGIISKDYNWNQMATRAGYMEIFAHALPAAYLPAINNIPDGAIPDVPMTHPQADAIYTLYRAGILQGSDAEHNCKPSDNIKRSEVSAILTRMMDSTARITFSMGEIPEELTIISQPANVACAVGDTAVFSVGVTGGKEAYKYQWQGYSISARKYLSIVGGTSATLSLAVKDENTYKDVSKVRCVITDADGVQVTSNEATLTQVQVEAPTITAQPQNVTCAVGDTATFKVTASGGKEPYTYQWQARGVGDFKMLKNGTGATLSLTTTAAMFDVKQVNSFISEVRCVITDANGTKVTTSAAKLTKAVELSISAQPSSVTCAAGDTATFKVTASGGKAPYKYQWEGRGPLDKNFMKLPGKTSDTLELTADDTIAEVRCVITDANGSSVTTSAAKLTKSPTVTPLRIITQPSPVTCAVGDTATFTVTAAGGKEPYTYQWQARGVSKEFKNLRNSSGATLNLTATAAMFDVKQVNSFISEVRCVITDADGNKVTSNAVKLTKAKTTTLTITSQPKDVYTSKGGSAFSASYTVEATGGKDPYTYQWQWGKTTGNGWTDIKNTDTWANSGTIKSKALLIGSQQESMLTAGYIFRCVITDADGNKVYTRAASLNKELTITKQPVSKTINIKGHNEIAQFKIEVTGGVTPYKYQWQYETATGYADITSNSFRSGTMKLYSDGTLQFSDLVATGSYNIRCKITDSAGNIIYSDPVVFKIERY